MKKKSIKKDKYAIDILAHWAMVKYFCNELVKTLDINVSKHDLSKLEPPERDYFEKYSPLLKKSIYGSKQYKSFLKSMKPALDHHYSVSRHHPEFHKSGIKDMNLVDLIEMICDWKASNLRHNKGDIYNSLEINQKRFKYTDELKSILKNTLDLLK